MSTRHVWVIKAWELTQCTGHQYYTGAAGLGLWHLLSCLQAPMLRESCSTHAGCFLRQEKPSFEYREGLNFYDLGA